MNTLPIPRAGGLLLAGIMASLTPLACDSKEEAPKPVRVAPPTQSTAAVTTEKTLSLSVVADGQASFLIDAPLEKIKGEAGKFRGTLHVNPGNLNETRGQVEVDLRSLQTRTFDDDGKNKTQSEHAQNWLELGEDVPERERKENQWARFKITSLKATPTTLVDAQGSGGQRRIEATAEGDLWLHGVSVPKTVKVALLFSGDATSPSGVTVETLEPLRLSLEEHDVKPRDLAGKFLQGALEKVGDKIVDEVQLTLRFAAATP